MATLMGLLTQQHQQHQQHQHQQLLEISLSRSLPRVLSLENSLFLVVNSCSCELWIIATILHTPYIDLWQLWMLLWLFLTICYGEPVYKHLLAT